MRLFRPPNLFTVPGDPLAGFLLAGGRLGWGIVPGALAALLLYSAGLLLNDFFDREADARERPERPVPSGAVPAGAVAVVGGLLLVVGALVGWAGADPGGRWVPLALAAAILAYDAALKRLPVVGPVTMGACRGGSVVLGAACAGQWARPAALTAAAILWAYTTAITVLAAGEARATRRGVESLAPGAILIAGCVVLSLVRAPGIPLGLLGVAALVFGGAEALLVGSLLMGGREAVPACIGRLVRVMLWAQGGWCLWTAEAPAATAAFASLFVALRLGAEVAGRKFYGS